MRKASVQLSRQFFGRVFKNKKLEKKLIDKSSFFHKWRGMLVPSWHLYANPSLRKTKINGLNFILNISDYMDWKAYFRIGEEESKAVFNKIKQDFTIIDVGANLGYYALHFADKAKKGKVFCFEPDPGNFKKLERNIGENNHQNIQLFNYGLGSGTGTFYLGVIDANNTGMNSIVSIDNNREIAHNEIYIKALDEVEELQNHSKIDLIKVDIEGYEYHFLEGAKTTIQKHHPIIFMELCDEHLRRQNSSAKEIISFLYELGYNSIVKVDNNRGQVLIDSNLENCQFDIICEVN